MESGGYPLTDEGSIKVRNIKAIVGSVSALMLLFFMLVPFKWYYRRIRFGIIFAQFNLMIAPFGNCAFKTYLWGEILTDCIIQLEDLGKVIMCFINWDGFEKGFTN